MPTLLLERMSITDALGLRAFAALSRDGWILITTRVLRMLSYGGVGVILAVYLHALGLPDERIGLLLFLTLMGDAVISLAATISADAVGRRRVLLLGCALKLLGSWVFFTINSSPDSWFLAAASVVAMMSPSGNEVGPFMTIEQSVLSDQVQSADRTMLFAWYNVLGYFATACGSFASGALTTALTARYGYTAVGSYRVVFLLYGVCALLLLALVLCLSQQVERRERGTESAALELARANAQAAEESQALLQSSRLEEAQAAGASALRQDRLRPATATSSAPAAAPAAGPTAGGSEPKGWLGLTPRSQGVVLRLALLFAADSFGGSMVTGSLLAYYFSVTYGVSNAYLGGILFGANVLAGASALASGWVATKIGLINTMVFTHLPSNIIMTLVPLMPNVELATAMVFLRFSISQMDVAPRQSFVSGITHEDERTAAMGITNIVKVLASACGPLITGYLASRKLFSWAFYLGGAIKITYDLTLLWSFRHMRAAHEQTSKGATKPSPG